MTLPSLRGALATKQSRGRVMRPLGCFAALAMTAGSWLVYVWASPKCNTVHLVDFLNLLLTMMIEPDPGRIRGGFDGAHGGGTSGGAADYGFHQPWRDRQDVP